MQCGWISHWVIYWFIQIRLICIIRIITITVRLFSLEHRRQIEPVVKDHWWSGDWRIKRLETWFVLSVSISLYCFYERSIENTILVIDVDSWYYRERLVVDDYKGLNKNIIKYISDIGSKLFINIERIDWIWIE